MALDPDVRWTLKIPGGLSGTIRRMMSGEGLALTYIQGDRDGQRVMLSSNQPGKIIAWDLDRDGPVVTTRGAFVAAFGPQINIDVTIARRAGAALFGGAGLFLQKISGQGTVLVHGAGDFIEQNLARVNRRSSAPAISRRSPMPWTTASGRRAACGACCFREKGLFMTQLTGPGRILLQTLKRARSGRAASSAAASG